jgi:hypothetical protein
MFELLFKTLLNYFVSLAISMVFWKITYKKYGKNPTKPASKFWRISFCFSLGFLWYNLLNAFMPNFVVFIPRKISPVELTLFILSTLSVLFFVTENIASVSKKNPLDTNQTDFRLLALFNTLYASIILLLAHFSTISIITSWISLGLNSAMEIANKAQDGKVICRFFLEKILKDMYIISIGIVVIIIFTKTIRI